MIYKFLAMYISYIEYVFLIWISLEFVFNNTLLATGLLFGRKKINSFLNHFPVPQASPDFLK